jgi:hypothetical protein
LPPARRFWCAFFFSGKSSSPIFSTSLIDRLAGIYLQKPEGTCTTIKRRFVVLLLLF